MLRFATTAILARLVGVHFLGVYSLALVITRIAEVVGTAGLESGILRFVSKKSDPLRDPNTKKDIYASLKMGFVFSSIVMIVQILLSSWLASDVFRGPELLRVAIICNAISLPFLAITIIAAYATHPSFPHARAPRW